MPGQDLLGFIRDLADHLALGKSVGEEVTAALAQAREHLESVRARYDEPAPEGAEVVRQYMLESLDLFTAALDHIDAFFAGAGLERLGQAVVSAEEGDDVLYCLEDVLAQSCDWISQFQTG